LQDVVQDNIEQDAALSEASRYMKNITVHHLFSLWLTLCNTGPIASEQFSHILHIVASVSHRPIIWCIKIVIILDYINPIYNLNLNCCSLSKHSK